MDYAQAVELKRKGFPVQTLPAKGIAHKGWFIDGEFECKIPDLEEILIACGKYVALVQQHQDWVAVYNRELSPTYLDQPQFVVRKQTAILAAAELWVILKNERII